MSLLLDTCAIIWAAHDPERLSEKTLRRMVDPEETIFVSAISVGELACLSISKRLELNQHWKVWFRNAIELNGWSVVPIDLEVIEEAYSLPEEFHTDPADRILVATARLQRLEIVTGDRKILNYPHVRSLA